jgi:hypothetical protein
MTTHKTRNTEGLDKPVLDALEALAADCSAAVAAERERCCGIVYGQCDSDNVAQRTVDAIRGVRRSAKQRQADIEAARRFWVIELTPAFPGHPPFPTTYYAGGREALGSAEQAKVQDIGTAPLWKSKEAAERVLSTLLHTKSCVWRVVEYADTPAGPIRITGLEFPELA